MKIFEVMHFLRIAAIWLFLAQLFQHLTRINAKVPAIIVFGDSTVDAGNNNQLSTILKSNFEPYGRDFYGHKPTGRFSNGRLATDFISQGFGLKPIPAYLDPTQTIKDFATGVCFASAGAGYDNVTSDVLSVLPLWKQLEYYKTYQKQLQHYLGTQKAKNVLNEALYGISLGTNDFLQNYYAPRVRTSQMTVDKYQEFLVGIAKNFLMELYQLGARKVLITGLPPMGCLPLERTTNIMYGSQCREEYNVVAKEFNVKLANLAMNLNKQLSGMQLVFSNIYDIFLEMIEKPSAFGFQNAAIACCASGLFEMSYLCDRYNPLTCTDASNYVFWDSFHPTEKTNSIIASYVTKMFLSKFK